MAGSTKKTLWCPSPSAAISISLVVVCVSAVRTESLPDAQTIQIVHPHLQKRSLVMEDVDLIEVCNSVQSFEQLDVAINVDLLSVEVHPDTWVFVTRCRAPGKPCKGFADEIRSICRPKKSWVQVYGRTAGDTWRAHWVAVDTACVCSIRKSKRSSLLSPNRVPLTGKTFLP